MRGSSPLTGGKPASLIKSHILKAVSGVNSLGFKTTTFPVAKAGPIFHENISMGNYKKVYMPVNIEYISVILPHELTFQGMI